MQCKLIVLYHCFWVLLSKIGIIPLKQVFNLNSVGGWIPGEANFSLLSVLELLRGDLSLRRAKCTLLTAAQPKHQFGSYCVCTIGKNLKEMPVSDI